ncbi:MAG: hypothetical protein GY769_10755 [bacterium]|nr:hypothetical protein [bacterium]
MSRFGWAVAVAASGLLFAGAGLGASNEGGATERTFFLLVDAVPYGAVDALYRDGGAPELFDELGPPAPLISTFPSTTTVALGAALGSLGLEISPGYEARFFDWEEETIRGGGAISYFRIDFPWRRFFEWSKKGVARSAVASLRPVVASERRVLRALDAFLASDRQDFFAYIETTDTAAHLRGPSSLDKMFRNLGLAIQAARAAGEKFRVVVFSDHGIAGGEPLKNVLPGILKRFQRVGLRRVKRLRTRNDVALTPYGLVSSLEVYAHDESAPRLAEVLTSVEGVGLCAYRAAGELWVVSASGLATIGNRGREWAYLPRTGDPLGYRSVTARLRAVTGESGEPGWFSDSEWFEATKDEFYPDALRRIARGFELVENPATVICSADPGYMYGARKTERAARLAGGKLRWTHGALHWEATAGFLLTDVPGRTSRSGISLSTALRPLLSSPELRVARGASQVPKLAQGNSE